MAHGHGARTVGQAHEAARQVSRAWRHRGDRSSRHRPGVRRGADRRGRGRGAQLQPLEQRLLPEPRPPAARRSRHPSRGPVRRCAVRAVVRRRCDHGARRGGVTRRRGPRHGRGARPRAGARGDRGTPARGGGGARAVRPQHDRAHARGARTARRTDRPAAVRDRLPRSLRARGRAGGRSPARSARATSLHPRHASRPRRGRRWRGGVAGSGPVPGHDRRRHGLGRRDGADGCVSPWRRAGRALLSRRSRARAHTSGGAGHPLQARARARHEPGRGDADRRGEGRAPDRGGRLAVQSRRVPRPQSRGHVLDVPHAAAHRRDSRRCEGRQSPLPSPARAHPVAGRDRRGADRDDRGRLDDSRAPRRRGSAVAEARQLLFSAG